VVFCGIIPFVVMPGAGVAVALPVIMVPGEVVWEDFLGVSGLTVTNTIIGTLVADVIVLWFALAATRNMKMVPGRLQGLFEVITDALWGQVNRRAERPYHFPADGDDFYLLAGGELGQARAGRREYWPDALRR